MRPSPRPCSSSSPSNRPTCSPTSASLPGPARKSSTMSRGAEAMRRIATLVLALALAGCGALDQEAMVMTVEPGWTAELMASEKDGFASPDGLLWANGLLYVADEGGSAILAWRPGARPALLADSRAGLASPEDLVRDES